MQNNKFKRVLLSSTLLALAGSPLAMLSATAQEAQAGREVVVVTGTRVVLEGYESSSPITTVSAEDLDRQQPTDVEDVLRSLPQFLPGVGDQVNNGSSGASTIDLRGLTTPRTLPLIDGKRMVGYDQNGLFDVTAVPIALLKRVEVVTGGASAVYGSDAVAGVVNFILNDEFKGAQLDTNYSITDHGDGEIVNVAATLGAGLDGGRGNVVLNLGYLDKESVYQTRGPGAATPGASSTTTPVAIDSSTGGRTQINSTGQLVPFYQGFDYNPQNLYQTPQKRWNATVLAKYDINDHVEAYSRFIYSNSHSAPQLASSGTFGFTFAVPLNNAFLSSQASSYLAANNTVGTCASLNPYAVTAPAGNCVAVGLRWRGVPVGAREYSFDYDTFQSLLGVRGEIFGWNYDLAGAHGETSLKRQQRNDIDANKVQQALFTASQTACSDPSNFCAPLNLFNPSVAINPAALDFIRLNLQVQSVTTQDYVTASVSRDLGDFKSPLAETPIGISFGAEYRRESADYQPDAASQSGLSPGFGQTLPTKGSYDVTEGFGEAIIPIVENRPLMQAINLELGFRHSDYSTSGGTDSYKYGADWSPIEGLRFRGMFQRAVRAANIAELYNPVTPGTGDLLTDPCANGTTAKPLAANLAALCIATGVPAATIANHTLDQPTAGQVNSFFGGNPNTTPEEADTVTFGVVWQPSFIPRLGATLDYYDIQVDNAIAIRPNYDIVDGCYNVARNTTMSASNADCQLIKRNLANGSIEGDLIYGINQVTRNIGEVHAEGIDYSVHYDFDLPGTWGNIALAFDGTHVLDSSYIPSPGGSTVSCEGHYGKQCGLPSTVSGSTGGPTPEDHWVQRTTWSWGSFDVSYMWRHLSGSTVDPTQAAATDPVSAKIPSTDYLDLAGSWQINDILKLKLAVTNVTDEEAPFVVTETGSTPFNSGNTYPSTYDPLGRIFQLGLTAKF